MAIDDHQIMLDGLRALFELYDDLHLISFASSRVEAIKKVDENVDIVLMDIDLGDQSGIDLARKILHTYPGIKIIGLSMHGEHRVISSFMKIGCHGYVNKNGGESVLINAIRSVYNGNMFLSSKTIQSMADIIAEASYNGKSTLTSREQEVLTYLTQDFTLKQIADKLFISPSTVESHKRNLMSKLEVNTISGLTRYAIKNKFIEA